MRATTEADALSLALLLLLERLQPVERTVFLLHDVFGRSEVEIARIVGEDERTCARRLLRAHRAIAGARRSLEVSRRRQADVVACFFRRFNAGDIESVREILAPDVIAYVGGSASQEPTVGRCAVACRLDLLFSELRQLGINVQAGPDGRRSRGRLYDREGRLVGGLSIEVADGLLQTIRVVRRRN